MSTDQTVRVIKPIIKKCTYQRMNDLSSTHPHQNYA